MAHQSINKRKRKIASPQCINNEEKSEHSSPPKKRRKIEKATANRKGPAQNKEDSVSVDLFADIDDDLFFQIDLTAITAIPTNHSSCGQRNV